MLEVRRQIAQRGYSETTVRSVAAACGVGVGTVYNYFESKDMLVASIMAEDWKLLLERARSAAPSGARETVRLVYDLLKRFLEEHRTLFSDPGAARKYSLVFSERHGLLRGQIADLLLPLCPGGSTEPAFLAQFIAESLITWCTAGVPFEELYPVVEKLL